MSNIHILDSTTVYRNPLAHVYSRQAYFPSVIDLGHGELLAAFSIGQAFEAADLHTHLARSVDGGISWALEGRLYPGTTDRPTSDACRLSRGEEGEVIAFVIRHDRSRSDQGLTNPENLGFVEVELLLFRSRDGGRSWSEPQTLQTPLEGPAFEMTSSIVPLSSGAWLLPTSTWRGWDGYCPNGMRTVAFVSTDQGHTWPEAEQVMVDPEQQIIYWESKIAELADGRLIAAAWAHNEPAHTDLPIQYAVSGGLGLGWSKPRSTGLIGQTVNLTVLPDNRILAVYRRTDRPGLWAALSRLSSSEEWIHEADAILWDGRSLAAASKEPENAAESDPSAFNPATAMQQQFTELRLGAPSICPLENGQLLVTFWVVVDGVSQIQALKLQIDES